MASTIVLQQRKTRTLPASAGELRDQSMTTPYSARMRKLDRNPYDGVMPELLTRYPAHSPLGSKLRQADAKLRLFEMSRAEEVLREQERLNAEIADRIARRQAEHALNMDYLIQFGVTAEERDQFREILNEVSTHGGLTLLEAAQLTQTRASLGLESLPEDRRSSSGVE